MKRPVLALVLLSSLLLMTAALAAGQAPAPAGSDAVTPRAYLPLVIGDQDVYDMADFIVGDGRLYEVWQYIASAGSETQARHQTQFEPGRFFHTKGNELYAQWEELWMDDDYVYRGTDTSPGADLYYTLRDDGQYGSKWSPRHWRVGDIFERYPWVTFYTKGNCAVDYDFPQRTWLKFVAYYPAYTFDTGGPDPITVDQVVELAWLLTKDGQPEERYFYARDFGLVGWANNSGDFSRVSEVHAPGARPDNTRELIPCLDTGPRPVPDQALFPPRPYQPPYRAK
ncbi:MAG: hypothetical protein PVG33_00265 [Chloroflexota bacterium]|jgi:hypothetical protein